MKEIWRYIKNTNKKYQVSNYGRIKSKKRKYVSSDRFITPYKIKQRLYAFIQKNNGVTSAKSISKLVLTHFKKKEIGKDFSIHIDANTYNNRSTNLEWGTRGDVFRKANELKKKKRGVYRHEYGKKNWKTIIKVDNKSETVGYFKTREDAEFVYQVTYGLVYGRMPY